MNKIFYILACKNKKVNMTIGNWSSFIFGLCICVTSTVDKRFFPNSYGFLVVCIMQKLTAETKQSL